MPAEQESTWSHLLTWGGWAALFTLVGVIVRQFLPLAKVRIAADERFNNQLMARIEKVETDAAADRLRAAEELKDTRTFYERKIEAILADARLDRHKMNNIDHCFTILITMIQKNPEKAAEAAEAAMSLRAEQEKTEAMERGAVMSGKIIAAGAPTIVQGGEA